MPPWQASDGCNEYDSDFSLDDTRNCTLGGMMVDELHRTVGSNNYKAGRLHGAVRRV